MSARMVWVSASIWALVIRGMRPVIVISSWLAWMGIHSGQSYPLSCGGVNVILGLAREVGCDAEAVYGVAVCSGRVASASAVGKTGMRQDVGQAGMGVQAVAAGCMGVKDGCRAVEKDCRGVKKEFTGVKKEFTRVKKEFRGVKKEFTRVNKEFTRVKKEFTGVKKEFTGVNKEFTRVKKEFTGVKKEFTGVKKDCMAVRKGCGGAVGWSGREESGVSGVSVILCSRRGCRVTLR